MKGLFLSVFLFVCFSSIAQQQVWKRFGAPEGLPSNTITAIAEARDGVMWLGSQSGLICFDGTSFKKIPVEKGTIQPYVETILLDKQNNVWVGSRNGLWQYDAASARFYRHALACRSASFSEIAWNEDSTGIIAGSQAGVDLIKITPVPVVIRSFGNSNVFRLKNYKGCLYLIMHSCLVRIDKKDKADTLYRLDHAQGFTRYEKEKCWIFCGKDKVVKIDDAGRASILKVPFNTLSLETEQPVYADKKGCLWFNTHDTVYCFKSLNDRKPEKHTWQKDNPYSITPYTIRLFTDRDSNIWAAGSGIAVLDPRIGKIRFMPAAQLSSTQVWGMLHDAREGKILYGTNHHVAIWNRRDAKITIVPNPPHTRRFTVTGILDYDEQHWCIATFGHGAVLLHKKTYRYAPLPGFHKNENVEGMLRLSQNNILIYAESGLYMHNLQRSETVPFPVNHRKPESVLCAIQLHNGSLCYGGSYGITIIDHSGKQVRYNSTTSENNLDVVFGLYETPDKKLFAANMSGGLYEWSDRTKKFNYIELAGNPVIAYCFAPVNDSSFVVTTNNGLVLYNHYTGESRTLNKKNGLPFNEFDQFGCFIDNTCFMASGPEGALIVERKDVVLLFHDEVDLRIRHNNLVSASISIPAGHQSLTAHIYIGKKQANHALTYQYHLHGLEEEWHGVEKSNEITYNYLPPGSYTLLVKSDDPNGLVKGSKISIPVVVVPLWHQTGWFKALVGLVCAGLLVFMVRYFSLLKLRWKLRRLEAGQKVANERMRISRELHDNVGSQLTYLITGLEASELMLKQQKTEQLTDNLDQLQQSARDSMQQLRDAIWALNKEEMTMTMLAERFKNWVHKMLALQQTTLRFETSIMHDITLDAIRALGLFRLLQEAIHNAIKHAGASEIYVTVLSEPNRVVCQVHDNGRGFTITNTEGNGLENMRARAAELAGTVKIESTPGKGTTVTLVIPVNKLNG